MRKNLFRSLLCATVVAASLMACGEKAEEKAPETEAKVETEAKTEEKAEEKTEEKAEVKDGEEVPVNEAAAKDPEVTLKMAEVNPLDSIVGQMDTKFKEEVERISGGSIKIDLQASGVLGSENDVLDDMLGGGGIIDMSRISAYDLTSYGAEKSKLLSIPYTFVSRDHFWNFATSDLAEEFLNESQEKNIGLRGLFYGEEGFRHFFSIKDKPINSIEDMKGMKIRVSNDPVMTGMVKSFDANPTVIAYNELYSALQTGVVDAAEQPVANYEAKAFTEVGPNIVLDGHTLGVIEVVISDNSWDKLTENQQQVLMDAGKIAAAYDRKISQDAEDEVIKRLKENGINVIEVTDKTPWQEACKEIIEENTSDQAETYKQILDLAK